MHDGSNWLFRDGRGRRYRYARIELGNDPFLGANATVMPGVRNWQLRDSWSRIGRHRVSP